MRIATGSFIDKKACEIDMNIDINKNKDTLKPKIKNEHKDQNKDKVSEMWYFVIDQVLD